MRAAAADMGVRIVRIQADGAVVIRERAVDLAGRRQHGRAVEEGDRAVGVERNPAVIVRQRTIDLAPRRMEIAAGDMHRCALWTGDLAPRERFDETRASRDRRLGRRRIVGIDAGLPIGRNRGGLRDGGH